MYTVHIRNNKTGRTRPYVVKNKEWDEGADYIWTDGNYSCDCNRAVFFAEGTEDEDKPQFSSDSACGDERFSIVFVELEDGTKLVVEGPR